MKYCTNCVGPNTRPGIQFDSNGVCYPCKVAATATDIDWVARKKELSAICDWAKQKNSSGYDCIIGVSGGKDSTRQALLARDNLGLRPLLVSCTYPPEPQSELGGDNLSNLMALGFDTLIVGPSPEVWRRLMRKSFIKYGNFGRPTEMALYATPPRIAIKYDIPLIFLGENNALTYGDMGGSTSGDANRMKYNNTLSGGDPTEFLDDQISEAQIYWHFYPTDEEMAAAGLRIVYLGYYYKSFNNFQNAEIARANGLKIRDVPSEDIGAINKSDALENDFVHINQMIKYFKFGFGKTTDEVCELIRLGKISRNDGIEMVRNYDGRCAQHYISAFCKYMNFSENQFWEIANSFRNPQIWKKETNGSWTHRFPLETYEN